MEKLEEEAMFRWRKDKTYQYPSLGRWVLRQGGEGSWTRRKVTKLVKETAFYRGNFTRDSRFFNRR